MGQGSRATLETGWNASGQGSGRAHRGTHEPLEERHPGLAEEMGMGAGKVIQPLRVALTGVIGEPGNLRRPAPPGAGAVARTGWPAPSTYLALRAISLETPCLAGRKILS